MNYDLQGRGIFVFSDPAGANSVLTLIDNQLDEGRICSKDFFVFSNASGIYPKQYDDIVRRIDFSEELGATIIKQIKPTFLFSATSNNDFEHKWRKVASSVNLKIISFIDHWTNYKERFTFNNETVFGDEIWVVNNKAKEEAINAGLPSNKIKVVENPYYLKVRSFIPKQSKTDFYDQLGIDTLKKTILFISDDIKRSFPSDADGNCTLGFDEYTVLSDIFDSIDQIKTKIDLGNFQFVVKLHPLDEINKFKSIIKKLTLSNLNIISVQDCDPLTLNYYSDYVLGMFSNMVIESHLLNKNILRVQIGEKYDPLSSAKGIINTIQRITHKEFLPEALLSLLTYQEGLKK